MNYNNQIIILVFNSSVSGIWRILSREWAFTDPTASLQGWIGNAKSGWSSTSVSDHRHLAANGPVPSFPPSVVSLVPGGMFRVF